MSEHMDDPAPPPENNDLDHQSDRPPDENCDEAAPPSGGTQAGSSPPPDLEVVDDERLSSAVAADELTGLLDDIAELERQVSRLQARQLERTAEYAARCRRMAMSRRGRGWSGLSRQLAAAEVAAARRVSVQVAERYLTDAVTLTTDLPRVLGVLRRGDTSLQAVRGVAAEVQNLLPETVPLADEILADDIGTVPPAQVRGLARTRVFELDPDAATEAALSARADRMVVLTDSVGVSMANLTAVLPAEQAAACHTALDTHARTLRHGGDGRSVGQIMADTLVERVTGHTSASPVPVTVGLVMADTTLLGLDDQPAQLPGLSPLPAPVARWLAARDSTWIRRLYTDPVDTSVTVADTKRRRFDGTLRELCLARDQRCRMPGCHAKIRHLDHTIDHAQGGPTTASNGRAYSERCHRLKHHPQVAVTTVGLTQPAGTRWRQPPMQQVMGYQAYTRWKLPTGTILASIPPPALGQGTTSRNQTHRRRQLITQIETTTSDTITLPVA